MQVQFFAQTLKSFYFLPIFVSSLLLRDKYMNQIRITTTQSFARLKASPKKIPDIVGIIIDDVVTSSVMFIGPLDRESILNKLLSAVTTPNNNPNKTVKNEIFSFKSNSPNNRTHTEYTIILKRFMCFAVFNAVLQELLKRQVCRYGKHYRVV